MYLSIGQQNPEYVYGRTFLMEYNNLSSTFTGVTGASQKNTEDLG